MRKNSFTFGSADLNRLRAQIGSDWLYVAGETLAPHFYTPVDVLVGTTADTFTVYSEAVGADFEDPDLEYAALSIRDVGERFEVAKRRGNVYVPHQRERIIDVLIVRESITATENGEQSWDYTTDIGVVFVLSKGAVAVAKGSHHTEMLLVAMGRTVEALDIPDRTIEWADDLTVQHRSTREFIPIKNLT